MNQLEFFIYPEQSMGNSQYIRKANVLRTQRCYIRYANCTFKIDINNLRLF